MWASIKFRDLSFSPSQAAVHFIWEVWWWRSRRHQLGKKTEQADLKTEISANFGRLITTLCFNHFFSQTDSGNAYPTDAVLYCIEKYAILRMNMLLLLGSEMSCMIENVNQNQMERDIHLRGSMWCRARVVGGHATIGRLSNNDFSTFQAIRIFFEKSRWTVTWQWSEVTRLSADCQTTIFRRFKQLEIFLKKSRWTVTRQWSEVTRPSADCQTTFFGRFKRFGKILKKSRWTVTRQWSEVRRPSADCQTTFFGRFMRFGKILKKVAERSRDSGRRSRDRRLTVKQRFWTFQAIWENFEKSRWTVTRQWSEVTRPSADCQTTFFWRFKRFGEILKNVAERSRDSGSGHATVGRLSNNVFWTFQAIWENFEKSRWTVTRQWSEFTRPSADCQTTFFGRFKRFWENFEKSRWTVTRQWLRSRDRRPTVKQRFLDVSSN